MFDVAHRLACRVLLTKLLELDDDIHPYPTVRMLATLAWVGNALVVSEDMQIMAKTREVFDNMLLKKAGYRYDNYRLVSR